MCITPNLSLGSTGRLRLRRSWSRSAMGDLTLETFGRVSNGQAKDCNKHFMTDLSLPLSYT